MIAEIGHIGTTEIEAVSFLQEQLNGEHQLNDPPALPFEETMGLPAAFQMTELYEIIPGNDRGPFRIDLYR